MLSKYIARSDWLFFVFEITVVEYRRVTIGISIQKIHIASQWLSLIGFRSDEICTCAFTTVMLGRRAVHADLPLILFLDLFDQRKPHFYNSSSNAVMRNSMNHMSVKDLRERSLKLF
ncbi:unnamed protein product [Rhizophagus irregularis]|nr:unnamed protein product [Rhizophagus irregularis]